MLLAVRIPTISFILVFQLAHCSLNLVSQPEGKEATCAAVVNIPAPVSSWHQIGLYLLNHCGWVGSDD